MFVVDLGFSQSAEKSRMVPYMEQLIRSNEMLGNEKMYKMQEISEFLSQEERMELYNRYQKVPGTKVVGCLLNMAPIPGLGSLIIGDKIGALMTFLGVIGGGGIGALSLIGIYGMGPVYLSDTSAMTRLSILMGATIAGFSLATIFYFNGLISPFFYSDNYNTRLALSLKTRSENIRMYGNKIDSVVPVIANIIPGLGIGSFAQGDVFGGCIGLGGELAGGVSMLAGIFSLYYPTVYLAQEIAYDPLSPKIQVLQNQINMWTTIAIVGGVIYGITKIFEIIRPFWYAGDYYSGLAYGDSNEKTFAFKPYVVPGFVNDKLDMQFGLNLEMGI